MKNDAGDEETREFTDEETVEYEALLGQRDQIDAEVRKESQSVERRNMLAEARRNAGVAIEQHSGDGLDVTVEDEPMVYGYGSPNSYFADMYYTSGIRYQPRDAKYQQALERQLKWSAQVEREIHNGTKYGKWVETQFREFYRDSAPETAQGTLPGQVNWKSIYRECRDRGSVAVSERGVPTGVESRAITTGGGATASASGGGAAAFVTPIFTEGDYVPFRQYGRVFADETTKRPLPEYGMAVYTPQITSGAQVSTSYETNPGEGGGVPESDPGQGYITAALIITAGQVTTSQAVLDRAGPGFEYDVVIWDQMGRNYDQNWDAYVITQALANAAAQNWSGNSGAFVLTAPSGNGSGGFTGQVAKAAAYMETLEGTALSPSHLFLQPARWRYISAWSDGSERPVVVPQPNGPFNAWAAANGNPNLIPEGNTGYQLGGLPIFTDPNIPTYSTANLDQAIVTDCSQTWSYEGAPVHRVLPQTLGGNLEVIFQQYSYGTVLQRYANAVVKIYGTGLAAISYTD